MSNRGRAVDLLALTVLVGGLAAGFLQGPRWVAQAYAQESLGFLNAIFASPSRPVEYYVGLVPRLTLLAGVAVVLLWAVLRWSLARPEAAERLRDRVLRLPPTLSPGEAIRTAVWFGLAIGLIEVAVRVLYYRVGGIYQDQYSPDAAWMGPLTQAAFVAGIVVGLLWMAGGRPRRIGLATVVTAAATPAIWGVLSNLRLGIHWSALLLLALGMAVQVAAAVQRVYGKGRVVLGRTLIPLALIPVSFFLMSQLLPRWRASAALRATPEPAAGAPNIILLVLDTTRKDNMSVYGYPRDTTPFLRALGAEALVYERAIAPSPWTLPSHAAFFTGRNVNETRTGVRLALDSRFPTIAEFLSEDGYATGGFTANTFFTTRESGLARGFGTYRDTPVSLSAAIRDASSTSVTVGRIQKTLSRWADPERKFAEDVNREFLDWVDGIDGRPFFAFLNYFDAHEPYERFAEQDRFRGPPPDTLVVGPDYGERVPLPAARRREVNRYDGGIAHMDAALEALTRDLQSRGLMENTILIVTADHGDQLGERGLQSHVNSLYGELLFVPLIIHAPGRFEGERITETVTLHDLAATIASLAGSTRASPFPGRPLTAASRGAAAFSELLEDPFTAVEGPIARGPMQSVVVRDWHYIRNGDGAEELYDLITDPREARNLAADTSRAQVLAEMRRALRRAVLPRHSPAH